MYVLCIFWWSLLFFIVTAGNHFENNGEYRKENYHSHNPVIELDIDIRMNEHKSKYKHKNQCCLEFSVDICLSLEIEFFEYHTRKLSQCIYNYEYPNQEYRHISQVSKIQQRHKIRHFISERIKTLPSFTHEITSSGKYPICRIENSNNNVENCSGHSISKVIQYESKQCCRDTKSTYCVWMKPPMIDDVLPRTWVLDELFTPKIHSTCC